MAFVRSGRASHGNGVEWCDRQGREIERSVYSGVCYNERCYNEQFLINKIGMLERTVLSIMSGSYNEQFYQ
jgi:hypothetical protein